jgi:hypothetical protein
MAEIGMGAGHMEERLDGGVPDPAGEWVCKCGKVVPRAHPYCPHCGRFGQAVRRKWPKLALVTALALVAAVVAGIAFSHSSPQKDVATLVVGSISADLTPEMVEKSPEQHLGENVKWVGKVDEISEAAAGRVFVVPVQERDITYTGRTSLRLRVDRTGKNSESYHRALFLTEYLYSGELPGIFKDATVEFTGQILGMTCRQHPLFKDRLSCFPLIGLVSVAPVAK